MSRKWGLHPSIDMMLYKAYIYSFYGLATKFRLEKLDWSKYKALLE